MTLSVPGPPRKLSPVTTPKELGQTSRDFADDDGTAPEGIRDLLTAGSTNAMAYLRAVAALCGSRVLLGIMASGDNLHPDGPDPNRHAEMAAVLLQRELPDGSTDRALPVFTGVDSLQAWQADARPIPATLDRAAEAAVNADASTLIVDVAGPATLMIEQPVLGELARGRRLVALEDGGYGWLQVEVTD